MLHTHAAHAKSFIQQSNKEVTIIYILSKSLNISIKSFLLNSNSTIIKNLSAKNIKNYNSIIIIIIDNNR